MSSRSWRGVISRNGGAEDARNEHHHHLSKHPSATASCRGCKQLVQTASIDKQTAAPCKRPEMGNLLYTLRDLAIFLVMVSLKYFSFAPQPHSKQTNMQLQPTNTMMNQANQPLTAHHGLPFNLPVAQNGYLFTCAYWIVTFSRHASEHIWTRNNRARTSSDKPHLSHLTSPRWAD